MWYDKNNQRCRTASRKRRRSYNEETRIYAAGTGHGADAGGQRDGGNEGLFRLYHPHLSNSNSTERVNWLLNAAKEAGFSISIDDNSVISGDNAAIQKANESKDGDIIFGLNETRWSQLVNGTYEN